MISKIVNVTVWPRDRVVFLICVPLIENIQKVLHKLFVLHLFFSYLCIVDKGMIFAPWAARKIFLAGEEYFPRETAKWRPQCDSEKNNQNY